MSRSHLVVVLSLLALLSFAAVGSAQNVNPTLTITTPTKTLALGPGESAQIIWTLANQGQANAPTSEGIVTLTASAPAEWTLTLNPASLTIPGGQSRTVTGTLTAPPAGGATPADGPVALTGTIRNSATGNQAQGTAPAVALTFNAPPAPVVVPPPPKDYTVLIVSLILLGLALAGAGTYLYLAGGVALVAENAVQPMNVGIDGVYRVRVENKANRPRIIELRVRELPRTWFAAFSFPFIRLQARETVVVPLYVKVPFTSSAGAVGTLVAQARPQGPFPWRAHVRVVANVVDVEVGSTYRPAPSAAPAEGAASTRVEETVPVGAPGVVVPLAKWGAMDEFTVKALATADVRDTEDLLHADPARLAKDTRLPEAQLRHWQSVADLVRVRGLDAKEAQTLVGVGVRSLTALAQETPQALLAKVQTYLESVGESPARGKVSAKSTKKWIEAARDLVGMDA